MRVLTNGSLPGKGTGKNLSVKFTEKSKKVICVLFIDIFKDLLYEIHINANSIFNETVNTSAMRGNDRWIFGGKSSSTSLYSINIKRHGGL